MDFRVFANRDIPLRRTGSLLPTTSNYCLISTEMGNSSQSYMTRGEAEALLGDAGVTLRGQLERTPRRVVDADALTRMISARFDDNVPEKLLPPLFKAFTSDSYVNVDDFLCALAVIRSKDKTLQRKFVFRVYETPSGQLSRTRVEAMLLLAYGELHKSFIKAFADVLFKPGALLGLKELEAYRGSTELMSAWVFRLLESLLEPLPPHLLQLERKYSSVLEAEELLRTRQVRREHADRYYSTHLPPSTHLHTHHTSTL